MTSQVAQGPLAGLKVVEFAGIGPGPVCGMMFADMGATVTLIDRKVANPNGAGVLDGADPRINIHNRGKHSIAIDLRQPAGVELALKLVEEADVLIEGFRPGVMEKLGVGPDVCLARNPRLVYGRMTGWGQHGPLAQAAGHEPNYMGVSGSLWYGGRPTQAPTSPLTLAGDIGGGTMVLAWGIMCALQKAQSSGEGQVVDAAITDGSAYVSTLLWSMYHAGGLKREFGRSWVDGGAPWSETYRCADGGYVNICALEPKFYAELVTKLGLAEDPRFIRQWDKACWPDARQALEELFASQPRTHWCDLLEGSDACFAPVLDFVDAVEHPHNLARDTFVNIDGIVQPAPAPKLSVDPGQAGVPPVTGGQTEQVLEEAGLENSVIEALKHQGVV